MKDQVRTERMKKVMREAGIDVLVCRLPENIVYLSGYWPVFGSSCLIFPVDGEPVEILPVSELDYAAEGWVEDQRTYEFINMGELANPPANILRLMREVWDERGYEDAVVGFEGSFDLVGGNNVAAEARVPTYKILNDMFEVFKSNTWVDATPQIKQSRVIKSPMEIESLRTTSEVTGIGLEQARDLIKPGVQESMVAGMVEGYIYGMGIGYKNVTRSRGYCFVMSGENSRNSWRPFCVASKKPIMWGEPVLVELDAVANGYFIDITRSFFVGEPDERSKDIMKTVQESVNAAIDAAKPGVLARELDAVARKVIDRAGYGEYFNHQLGHGIGLQFHEAPWLHPASDEVLQPGMTVAVEPAIYIDGWGGFRIEDNIVITDEGCDVLTPLPQLFEPIL
ncbi:Xaa-Pro peptidase family protein [bacterium]|nr:Xaa-Pro peptidase family protein [bacterium]